MDDHSFHMLDQLALKVAARLLRRSATDPDLQAWREELRVPTSSQPQYLERFLAPEHLLPLLAQRLDDLHAYFDYPSKGKP